MALVQTFSGGMLDNPSGTTGVYNYASAWGTGEQATWGTNLDVVEYALPVDGSFRNFRVLLTAAPGVGATRYFYIGRNGAQLYCTVQISGTIDRGTSAVGSFGFYAGDRVSVVHLPQGSPASCFQSWSVDFVPADPRDNIWCGSSVNAIAGSTAYVAIGGGTVPSTTEANVAHPIQSKDTFATLYTITTLTVRLTAAPGSGKTRTITIFVNGLASAATLTISDLATTGTWTGTLTIATGDRVSVETRGAGTPATARVQWGIAYRSAIVGAYTISGGSYAALNNTSTVYYAWSNTGEGSWGTTGRYGSFGGWASRFMNYAARLTAAPTPGSRQFADQANANLSASITGSSVEAKTGALSLGLVPYTQNSVALINTGTPTAARAAWSYQLRTLLPLSPFGIGFGV